MSKIIVKTLKRVFMGGLYGFIILSSTAYADDQNINDRDLDQSLTLLRDYNPDGAINGAFEAERRAWLASVRARMKKANPDPDSIAIEELDDDVSGREGALPRDTLNDYMDQIKKELEVADVPEAAQNLPEN